MLRSVLYMLCAGLLFFQLMCYQSCVKEYSYEGGPRDTLDTIPRDTIPIDTIPNDTIVQSIVFPYCQGCVGRDDYIMGTWNFKYDTFFFCGNITRALLEPTGRSAFTFFGPSTCSLDTGLIMTVYLSIPLISDSYNITTSNVFFQYYNNIGGTGDIFYSREAKPFSLTIEQYTGATGIATGHFSGYVDTDHGTTVQIKEGKFMIQFD